MTNIYAHKSILYLLGCRTIYIGVYPITTPVIQGISSFIVSIDDQVSLTHGNSEIAMHGRSFLIPAGETYTVDSKGSRIAHCYLDPYNQDFFRLSQQMKTKVGNVFTESKRESVQSAAFEKMLMDVRDTQFSKALLESVVFPSSIESPRRQRIDQRVVEIIDIIQGDPSIIHGNRYLAKRINVSEVTLMRLFKATTGVTIRRFRLWCRVIESIEPLFMGSSTTDAVIDVGFFDAPHFNHSFKGMLGMNPLSIIQQMKNMDIITYRS